MTTHIFIRLSSLTDGQWFRLDCEPEGVPPDIAYYANTIMRTPDPGSVVKDKGGKFDCPLSTYDEVRAYITRFPVGMVRRAAAAQEG